MSHSESVTTRGSSGVQTHVNSLIDQPCRSVKRKSSTLLLDHNFCDCSVFDDFFPDEPILHPVVHSAVASTVSHDSESFEAKRRRLWAKVPRHQSSGRPPDGN